MPEELEALVGSLGEGQPNFRVLVDGVISLDQMEEIWMLLRQSCDEARIRMANVGEPESMDYIEDCECDTCYDEKEGWCPDCNKI
jgi:hypothetical protein